MSARALKKALDGFLDIREALNQNDIQKAKNIAQEHILELDDMYLDALDHGADDDDDDEDEELD